MSAVGAVARLLDTIASWVLREDGYKQWSLERQAARWNKEFKDAMRQKPRDLERADRALARLRQLRNQNP